MVNRALILLSHGKSLLKFVGKNIKEMASAEGYESAEEAAPAEESAAEEAPAEEAASEDAEAPAEEAAE